MLENSGIVRKVTRSAVTIDTPDGGVVTVCVTSRTLFRRDDENARISDLRSGDAVEVLVRRDTDGAFEALLVEIEAEQGAA